MTSLHASHTPPKDLPFDQLLGVIMSIGLGNGFGWWYNEELAYKVGVSQSTISSWRRGRSLPSNSNYLKLRKALGLDQKNLSELELLWLAAIEKSYADTKDGRFASRESVSPFDIDLIPELEDDTYERPELDIDPPQQSNRALKFKFDNKKISFDDDRPPTDTISDQFIFLHSEIKIELKNFIYSLDPKTNQFKELRDNLVEYENALGVKPSDLSRPDVWRLGRHLRKLRLIDERRNAQGDSEDPAYPPKIGADLEDIVVLHNTLSANDPVLDELDRRGSDPAENNIALASRFAMQVLIDASKHPEFIEPVVPETLNSLIQDRGIKKEIEKRDLILGVDSTQNAIILILTQAVIENKSNRDKLAKQPGEFKKGFLNTSGKITAGSLITGSGITATAFVHTYADDILQLARRLPGAEVIETIVHWILQIPI